MAKHTLNYTGTELDKLLGSIGDKYGYLATSSGTDASSYYHLYTFASKAKWDEWVASGSDTEKIDPETGKKYILQDMAIPISTLEGASYAATLDIDTSIIPATANIVLDKDSLIVPVRYRSLKADPTLGRINAGISGKVEVQRKTVGDWTTVGTLKEELISKDETDLTFVNIDLGEFLANGNQEIRLQAMYTYVDEEGATRTVRSSAVMVGRTVTRTNLRLKLVTDFHRPMEAFDKETGLKKNFGVEYTMFGDCDKTLKVTIEGSIKEGDAFKSKSIESKNGVISIPEESAFLFLEHGVRKVTAWIEAPDGLGNTLYSNTLVNSFMVVNRKSSNYDANKKYLLVQNKLDSVTNFIQSDIMSYAVYSEDIEAETELKFSLTDASNNSYVDIMAVAKSNTPYTLSSTIEIESSDEANPPTEYRTRLYVFRDGDNNFIEESGIHDSKFFSLIVDNSEAIVPIPGATFLLNPKNRSNDIDPYKIYNAARNNIEVPAEFTNFGLTNDLWVVDDYGYKCLRVLAGQELIIKRNIWAQFLNNPNSSMTIDIDFRVRNITNTEEPIVQIAGSSTGNGIILNPLTGWVRTKSYNNADNCMLSWRENVRQFMSVNINNNVSPKKTNVNDVIYSVDDEVKSNGTLALARVLLNGDPVREITFNKEDRNEWCDDENASIIIGSSGADIDIYSIRVYEEKRLDWIDLLNKNYLSSIPSTDEKFAIKRKNDLYDVNEGRITLEKARAAGLNCIVYHGQRPYVNDKSEDHAGYIEYFRYDSNGNELKEYSGTNCIGTKSLKWKAQGSTAKTYYEHNMQDDNSKVKKYISVLAPNNKDNGGFHDSIHVRIEGDKAYIYGGNLGKNFPLENTEEAYEYDAKTNTVSVPDGWIDGNGKYRGMGYMVAEGTSLAQKKVAKINYASAMQSHLLGACKSYDDLHFAVVGATPMQQQALDKGNSRPVSAKHTEPFLMFWEQGDGVIYYTGLCIYGAGKMDKVSWGYAKKKHPMFSLIEGSDNNLPMTDFRVPFDKNTAVYDCGEEYWAYVYKDSKGDEQFDGSWDFDGGKTVGYSPEEAGDDSIETQMADGWKFKFSNISAEDIAEEAEAPSAKIRDDWAMKHNFIYLNSSNIKYFVGSFEKFKQSTAANDFNYKYWCTEFSKNNQGEYQVYLYRYDYYTKEWIHSGLLDESTNTYRPINLATDIRTRASFTKYETSADFDKMNDAFKADMAKFMRDYGELFVSLNSLTFNYGYVLSFLAGTDNSSKNTYFKTDPIAQDMSSKKNDVFDDWFELHFGREFNYKEVYQIFLDGDDMDSILPVNNKGNMTKPYYIERKYPYREGDSESLYEGMNNQLFNFIEIAYSEEERSGTMYSILKAANALVNNEDVLLGYTGSKVSVWGFLHKYFFNVQYYFPQIAYIEQARIRYEFAQLIGNPGAARGVLPISQSIGSQVENEQQFMEQRLVYIASFAGFGALGNVPAGGSIGISDAEIQLSFQAYGTTEKPETISVELRPYQYIYPFGLNGQTIKPTYKRVSPHETCVLTLADNVQKLTDTSLFINGINYYKSIGNVGDTAIYSTNFQIVGKRITEFVSEPTREDAPFKAFAITVDSPLIERFSLKGSKNIAQLDGSPIQSLNLTSLTRCKEIDTRGAKFSEVTLPQSTLLEKVYLGSEITKFAVERTPNLSLLQFDSIDNIRQFVIGRDYGKFDSKTLMSAFYLQQIPLDLVVLEGITWTIPISMMMWMTRIKNISVIGNIIIEEPATTPAVTFEYKNLINQKWGDVDHADPKNGLLLTYKQQDVGMATIMGNYYNEQTKHPFTLAMQSKYDNKFTKILWSAVADGLTLSEFFIDPITGVLTTNELSKGVTKVIVSVNVYYGEGEPINVFSKTIKVYDRPAKVGDLVYFDGTYGDATEYDGTKTTVGVCIYTAPRYESDTIIDGVLHKAGEIVSEYHDPKDIHTRLMIGLKNITCTAGYGKPVYSSFSWGTDSWNLQAPINGVNTLLSNSILSTKTFYDVYGVRNLSTSGISGNITESNFRDESNILNNGFIPFSASTLAGDGFAYDEPNESGVDFKSERTLNEELASLVGDASLEGKMVNSSMAKTLNMIKTRNEILKYGAYVVQGSDSSLVVPPMNIPNGLTELAKLFDEVLAYVKENLYGGTSTSDRWMQICFPSASAAFEYEPSVNDTEQLDRKFTKHHWFLPTSGILSRVYWYNVSGAFNSYVKSLLSLDSAMLWSCTETSDQMAAYVAFSSGSLASIADYMRKLYGKSIRPICSF